MLLHEGYPIRGRQDMGRHIAIIQGLPMIQCAML